MRRRRKNLTPDSPLTPVPDEILDHFVRQGAITPEELDAAVRKFKKAIIERALGGELTHHLGYPSGGEKPDDTPNHRNGTGGMRSSRSSTKVAFHRPRRKMQTRMDAAGAAAGAMDAENASTAPWKAAQSAVSHSAHTQHQSTRSTHEIPNTPRWHVEREAG